MVTYLIQLEIQKNTTNTLSKIISDVLLLRNEIISDKLILDIRLGIELIHVNTINAPKIKEIPNIINDICHEKICVKYAPPILPIKPPAIVDAI